MSTNTITISSEQSKDQCDAVSLFLRGELELASKGWKDVILQKCIRCVTRSASEAEECSFPTVAAVACPLISLRREILSDAEWQKRVDSERQKTKT